MNQKNKIDEIWAIIYELAQSQKETDRQLKETDRQLKETSQSQKETDRQLKESFKVIRKEFSELKKYVGGIGRNNGDVAESYFYETLAKKMKIGNLNFHFIEKNVKKENRKEKLKGEYDIILTNSDSIAIVETKYKVHQNDIEKIKSKTIPNFRKLFPEKENYKIYAVIAGLCIPDDSIKLAFDYGFYVLTHGGGRLKIDHGDIKVY